MTAPGGDEGRHGVIALEESTCTSCLICVRECPTWCIDLTSRTEEILEEGARRPRSVNVLESFSIDYALCMYCGICIEACPFDSLSWQEAVGYVSVDAAGLVHGIDRLASWLPEAARGQR